MSERINDSQYNEDKETSFDILSEERERLEKIQKKAFYTGLFVNREELYRRAPAHLENTVEKPHVTTKFAPGIEDLHIDELGSSAKITVIGYGNNGRNEGLLVKVEADDPVIQEAIDKVRNPHITLSYSEGSHPKDTIDLDFELLPEDKQFELSGTYCIHLKNKDLVDNQDDL